LRNDLAHDIRFVNFTFASHVEAMDDEHLKNFRKRFDTWSTSEQHEGVPVLDFFRSTPKRAIWFSGMVTIGIIYGIKQIRVDARQAMEEARRWGGFLEFAAKLAAVAKTALPPVETLDNPESGANPEEPI
jgi:hypothetical protein